MSADDSREGFLRRWSRQKIQARETPPVPAPEARREAAMEEPAPVLPPVEELTIESDFSGFFHPKVGEDVRRNALRKLFSDPHFNVMDGLDTYIDDYSISEPIPAAMLASMKQAQRIIDWAAETEEQAVVRRATPPALPVDDEEEARSQTDTDKVPGIPVAEGNEFPSVPPPAEGGCRMAATSPMPAPRDDIPTVIARNDVTLRSSSGHAAQSRESPLPTPPAPASRDESA